MATSTDVNTDICYGILMAYLNDLRNNGFEYVRGKMEQKD